METPGRCDVAELVFRLAERFGHGRPTLHVDVAPAQCVALPARSRVTWKKTGPSSLRGAFATPPIR